MTFTQVFQFFDTRINNRFFTDLFKQNAVVLNATVVCIGVPVEACGDCGHHVSLHHVMFTNVFAMCMFRRSCIKLHGFCV